MHLHRTRLKKDIVAEFLPPSKPSHNVLILCEGMPTMPSKKKVIEFFAEQGWWVFHPRYRGSWESNGEFLKISPHEDILDIIDALPKGFTSIWTGEYFKINPEKIVLLGSSFGGPAALLASSDPRITKAIALSPVIDWTVESKDEPLDWLYDITKQSFGQGYRLNKKYWNKLSNGIFYNPIAHTDNIDGKKIYIIGSKDDTIIDYKTIETFTSITKCKTTLLKTGGHLSLSKSITPRLSRWINAFIHKE